MKPFACILALSALVQNSIAQINARLFRYPDAIKEVQELLKSKPFTVPKMPKYEKRSVD